MEGIAHARKGNFQKAIQCFVDCQKLNPNNALSWYNIGTSLAMISKQDHALLILYCYDRTLELDPYNAEAWNNKGAILEEIMGAEKNAMACYERAFEIRPNYASARSNIELLLKKQGRKLRQLK